MKKLMSLYLLSALTLLAAGCTLDVLEADPGFDGTIGGVRITVDVESGEIDKYSVLSASLGIVGPTGLRQYTNWTVASTNQQFTFQSTVPGLHYICLTDRDSLGDTNIFSTNAMLSAGHNYRLLLRLGAGTKKFGIYSESAPLGVNWGIPDVAFDIWDGTTAGAEEYGSAGDGISNTRYTGGGAGWLGISWRVNPVGGYKDMHSYREGSLRFMYRGTKRIRVGIQDLAGIQRWVYGANIMNFGLKTNNTWCSVVIPFTNFATNMNFNQIANYFTVIGDAETGFAIGDVYRFDNIYWCNKTN